VNQLEGALGLKPIPSTEQLHDALEKEYSEIELGDTVVDTVSEYKGIVTCVAEYDGYTSIEVTRKGDAESKWFGINRLEKSND